MTPKKKLNPRLLSLLRRSKACDEALTYLSQQTAVQAALDGARLEWLEWAISNILPPSALAEYDRVTTPAWAEYQRVEAPAWAEFQRVTAPALAEYERVTASAARSIVLAWYEEKCALVPATK